MKKIGILNKDISEVVAGMGHLEMLVVADAGLPVPAGVRRIDLAVREGLPGILEVVETISAELQVECFVTAEEMGSVSPQLCEPLEKFFEGAHKKVVSHEVFKKMTQQAVAVIRTGEFTPYANVILISGVVF
jgi:D-ribose pyranase